LLVLAIYPLTIPVGGVKLIVALEPVVFTRFRLVGGLGKEFVVTGSEAIDVTDVPETLVAVAVNVYAVLALSPVTNIGLDDPVATIFPGELVIEYCVIGAVPVVLVNDTLIYESLTMVPVKFVGGFGNVVTMIVPAGPVPALLLEYTFRLYTVLVNKFSMT